jgi:hypothetical protein
MAKNDVVLLDSILKQKSVEQHVDIGEIFEKFVLEQILKNYDLSNEEIAFGWTDGSLDGGIDGFYVLVNGLLVTDASDFSWPRTGAEIEVYLITCKHRDTFQQTSLDAMLASLQEIFDLTRNTQELLGSYSSDIRKCREIFIATYHNLSLHRPVLKFKIIYASRGDTELLGKSIAARADQIIELLSKYFSACSASFQALGASELVGLYREIKSFSLDLPVQECLTASQEGYVVLAHLRDYKEFVSDEKGKLRRYLFDSNVRAYLGANLVNVDIAETLSNLGSPNFWWLNNGVTILATSASIVGKCLKLKDIQIVNGLQTTESIYRHYSLNEPNPNDKRSLLIKVIVTQEEDIRDQVIRATNNQSLVEPAALHATDHIQRDIEDILLRHDWYYERRTNFYKNEGRPDARILSPLILATGSVALLLKNPVQSSRLKQKHLRTDEAYQSVYSTQFPLDAWPKVPELMRISENGLIRHFSRQKGGKAQYLSALRGPLAYVITVRLIGSFSYSHRQLATINTSIVTDEFINDCLSAMASFGGSLTRHTINSGRFSQTLLRMKELWSIEGDVFEGRRQLSSRRFNGREGERFVLTEEFLEAVNKALPPQPWKKGTAHQIAKNLGVERHRVSHAITTLVKRGVWLKQRNGIVYDKAGNEIMRDPTRVYTFPLIEPS